MTGKVPAKNEGALPFDEWYDTVRALMERAQTGSRKAEGKLAKLLEAQPEEVASLNWDKSVRTHLIAAATTDTDPSRHMIPRHIEGICRRLRRNPSSEVEDLLIERVLTCWTHMFAAEMRWTAKVEKGMTFQEGDYYQRALDRAHGRYVSALRALAEIRKVLGVSVGMVNIVQNQTVTTGHVDAAVDGPPAQCAVRNIAEGECE